MIPNFQTEVDRKVNGTQKVTLSYQNIQKLSYATDSCFSKEIGKRNEGCHAHAARSRRIRTKKISSEERIISSGLKNHSMRGIKK